MMVSMELGWGSFKSMEILWPFWRWSLSLKVSFPLVGRESAKLVKVEDDDLWADDNDDDDVVKSADESGSCFFAIFFSRLDLFTHKKVICMLKNFNFLWHTGTGLLVLTHNCKCERKYAIFCWFLVHLVLLKLFADVFSVQEMEVLGLVILKELILVLDTKMKNQVILLGEKWRVSRWKTL